MGFEYKIVAQLSDAQLRAIQNSLEYKETFCKRYVYNGKDFWELKQKNNTGKLPDCSIVFEPDGIYICQYLIPNLWNDLPELKNYLETNDIEYKVLDYSE